MPDGLPPVVMPGGLGSAWGEFRRPTVPKMPMKSKSAAARWHDDLVDEPPAEEEDPAAGENPPWWPEFTAWLTGPSSMPGVPLWWNLDGPEIARLRRLYARGFRID